MRYKDKLLNGTRHLDLKLLLLLLLRLQSLPPVVIGRGYFDGKL